MMELEEIKKKIGQWYIDPRDKKAFEVKWFALSERYGNGNVELAFILSNGQMIFKEEFEHIRK